MMITLPIEEKLATEIMFLRLFQIYGWEQYETAGGKERAFKRGYDRIIFEPNRDGNKYWTLCNNEVPSRLDMEDKELVVLIIG